MKQLSISGWLSRSLCLAMLLLLGCQTVDTPSSPNVNSNPGGSPAAESTNLANNASQTSAEKIKFKQGDGAERYSLKFKADGAKFVDAKDQEIARLIVDTNQKVKIKDASDQVLGYVVSKGNYWKLENGDQTKELYIFRRQDDGDFKLETSDDQLVYRIKARDDGYEIEKPDKTRLYKLKVKEGKLSLRNAQDQTILSTRSAIAPAAMICFGFDMLTPPQQVALAYAVHRTGGQ